MSTAAGIFLSILALCVTSLITAHMERKRGNLQ
jgi:hypothetical protein